MAPHPLRQRPPHGGHDADLGPGVRHRQPRAALRRVHLPTGAAGQRRPRMQRDGRVHRAAAGPRGPTRGFRRLGVSRQRGRAPRSRTLAGACTRRDRAGAGQAQAAVRRGASGERARDTSRDGD